MMIGTLVFSILSIGAVCTFLIPESHRNAHILLSLIPAAAGGVLLLRIPLPDSFSIPWAPGSLFPDPLEFRAGSSSVTFALFFCFLLTLIVWTRPLRRSMGRTPRLVVYLLVLAGITACFANSPLAVIVTWSLIDFLSFLVMLFLKSPIEIGSGGISTPFTHSMGVLAINMLGTILVAFSLFMGPAGVAEWSVPWGASPIGLASILFLSGILFRILLAPIQFTFSRIQTTSAGTELLLRILSPAVTMCLLSAIWPPTGSGWQLTWPTMPLAIILLLTGWQWCLSSSAFGRRDTFFLLLPGFTLLTAIALPDAAGVFTAGGGMLILGGGILLLYTGYLTHQRWLAIFPVFLGIVFAGIPFFPFSIWSGSVYPGLLSSSGFPLLLVLGLLQIFILCAVFRLAFEPVEEFPSNEPAFLLAYAAGMAVASIALFLPGWKGVTSIGSVVIPPILLAGGWLLILLIRQIQRIGSSATFYLEKVLRLEWLQRAAVYIFQQAAALVSGMESFLSGEGAMLWSLGIALLLYLVFRGG
jgi:hypothetical protein